MNASLLVLVIGTSFSCSDEFYCLLRAKLCLSLLEFNVQFIQCCNRVMENIHYSGLGAIDKAKFYSGLWDLCSIENRTE